MRIRDVSLATALVVATSIIGSRLMAPNLESTWYQCVRPEITPPSYVFPIVWTAIYACIIVAFARSMHTHAGAFVLNLVLNVAWSFVFFAQKSPSLALVVMLLLLLSTLHLATQNKDRVSKQLMYPYFAWLVFAAILNVDSAQNEARC